MGPRPTRRPATAFKPAPPICGGAPIRTAWQFLPWAACLDAGFVRRVTKTTRGSARFAQGKVDSNALQARLYAIEAGDIPQDQSAPEQLPWPAAPPPPACSRKTAPLNG